MPRKNPKLHDAAFLRQRYVVEHKSQQEIGDEIGATQSGVRNAMRRYGIQARARAQYIHIPLLSDGDLLRHAYLQQGKSHREIAAMEGCDASMVLNALKRHGIQRRPGGRAQSVFAGAVYGQLRVIAEVGRINGARAFRCSCDCGAETIVATSHLTSGHTRSCGCLNKPHGFHGSPTYTSWSCMLQRCSYPKTNGYENYGGRGITVCAAWRESFVTFLADMGERPEGMTLDRIDVDGNYESSNCRWADRVTQMANRRKR